MLFPHRKYVPSVPVFISYAYCHSIPRLLKAGKHSVMNIVDILFVNCIAGCRSPLFVLTNVLLKFF